MDQFGFLFVLFGGVVLFCIIMAFRSSQKPSGGQRRTRSSLGAEPIIYDPATDWTTIHHSTISHASDPTQQLGATLDSGHSGGTGESWTYTVEGSEHSGVGALGDGVGGGDAGESAAGGGWGDAGGSSDFGSGGSDFGGGGGDFGGGGGGDSGGGGQY